jgi:hypothetical protein
MNVFTEHDLLRQLQRQKEERRTANEEDEDERGKFRGRYP